MKSKERKLLYKGMYTIGDYLAFGLFIVTAFWLASVKTNYWLGVYPIVLLFTGFILLYSKRFDVCDGFLIIKYPKLLLIKASVIDLKKVKKLVFKLRFGRGTNDTLIVEYEGKKIKYHFWSLAGNNIYEIVKYLREQSVSLEVHKVYGWFDERIEK